MNTVAMGILVAGTVCYHARDGVYRVHRVLTEHFQYRK